MYEQYIYTATITNSNGTVYFGGEGDDTVTKTSGGNVAFFGGAARAKRVARREPRRACRKLAPESAKWGEENNNRIKLAKYSVIL